MTIKQIEIGTIHTLSGNNYLYIKAAKSFLSTISRVLKDFAAEVYTTFFV
jgi:hypothetical protein